MIEKSEKNIICMDSFVERDTKRLALVVKQSDLNVFLLMNYVKLQEFVIWEWATMSC